jgi:hypothetical protein
MDPMKRCYLNLEIPGQDEEPLVYEAHETCLREAAHPDVPV